MNSLIMLRDGALDVLGGRAQILNDEPDHERAPTDPVAELADVLVGIKTAAISTDGLRVDYAGLRRSPAYAAYRRVVSGLRELDRATLGDRDRQLAFWINLYNGLAIDAVVQFAVRGSVIAGPRGALFFRRAAYRVAGLRFSLEDIEHGVLRANAGNPLLPGAHFAADDPRMAFVMNSLDPRIHFALNCAGRSCPPIGAYNGERIATQLDLAARQFVAAATTLEQGVLTLSKLFDWYAQDFGGDEGVLRFVLTHLPPDDHRRTAILECDAVDVAYAPYDWGLNEAQQ